MKDLITVIVPVYNTGDLLFKCIDSLLNQTWSNTEIIIVDDGSTDNSRDIINTYQAKYPERIQSLFKENGGQASARNEALNIMKGQYVCFVDSDDWIQAAMLSSLHHSIVQTKSDISICDFQTVDEHNNVTGKYSSGDVSIHGQNVEEDKAIVFNLIPQVTGKLFNSQLFEQGKNRFPEGIWYEDLALLPVIMMSTQRISKVNEFFYQYFKRAGSTTTSFTLKVLDALIAIDFIDASINKNLHKKLYTRLVKKLKYRTLYITAIRLSNVEDVCQRKDGFKILENYFLREIPSIYNDSLFKTTPIFEKIILLLVRNRLSFLVYWLKKIKLVIKKNKE